MENDSCKSGDSDSSEHGREVFSHDGVIFKSPITRDDDSQCTGALCIVDYPSGKCIEWKPTEVSIVSECQEQEWAMVNTVGRRSRSIDGSQWRYQPVKIQLSELKGYRVSQRKTKLMLMQKNGTIHNAFFFQLGNADRFTKELRLYVKTKRSRSDSHYYVIVGYPDSAQSLKHSFSELNLLNDDPRDAVWKFFHNLKDRPYETTLYTFSKVSDYLLNTKVGDPVGGGPEDRPEVVKAIRMMETRRSGEESGEGPKEEGYQMIERPLPPRPHIHRGPPLDLHQWSLAMDAEGRIADPLNIKETIFRGGINPSLRYEVWKYLLGYYPWESTNAERQELKKKKVDDYFRMKLQWRSMTLDQEARFADFRDRKSLIEKDVNRTDRTIPFFSGENNPNLGLLYDILMTYVMYNFDLGYVQGMSDLLSPILNLMTSEVDAFWCFVGFMDKVYRNFDMDQAGMKKQLSQLHTLLSASGPSLATYLNEHESGNMFFCFRWLLVWFKREFSLSDIMTLWEVLWTGLPCSNFHLLLCVAILDTEKNIIMENNYGFTEILKHVNDLSCKMDVESLLKNAEAIFRQLESSSEQLTMSTKRVLGLAPSHSASGSSEEEETTPDQPPPPESPPPNDFSEIAYERGLENNFL